MRPGAAGLERQHQRARALAVLEVLDDLVARAPGQAAVVAGDRRAGVVAQVVGQAHAPLGEVGEDQDPLAGGEHRVDDLLEPGELAGATGQRPVVVLVGGRVVADLLERGDRREDGALAGLGAELLGVGVGHQAVEHRLVEADLLGGHRAVVELVDALGQLGGDDRLGLGAAEHEDAVERPQRRLGTLSGVVAPADSCGDERACGSRPGRGW